MPFQNISGLPFKANSIRRDAPSSSGVYGLSNARQWIYVGETDNIQARLLQHLEETNSVPADDPPTGFNFELWDPDQRAARQRQLIVELDPAGNRQMKRRTRLPGGNGSNRVGKEL